MGKYDTFLTLYENSFRTHWERNALTDYRGKTKTYCDVATTIARLHLFYKHCGIEEGDKIAVCGRNSANWGVAFLSIITYGAVAVPILHDFKEDNVHHIVCDSDSRLLFIGDSNRVNIKYEKMPNLEAVIRIEDFSLPMCRKEEIRKVHDELDSIFAAEYPEGFSPADINYHKDSPEELAIINYTSGTSGFSKGVQIPYRALASNIEFAVQAVKMNCGHRVLSILPMAHMYGMAFEFLYELTVGAEVFFLSKAPSPRIIFEALSKVKPYVIISVPLIIEKVISKMIMPKLKKPAMRFALAIPIVNSIIYRNIRRRLIQAFGGEIYEIIIGGAALSSDIDDVLHKIKFPFTVGYGATECAPIICYAPWDKTRCGSCGKAALNMEVKVLSSDPERIAGEIVCRGKNVMLGYYKNAEGTATAIDEEGWYHTGDLGVIDRDGFVYIKGRCKSMLLGANGQNIYPEEIEEVINKHAYIAESVVVQRGNQFIALVYPDAEVIKKENITNITEKMEELRRSVNSQIPAYEHISKVEVMEEEFEKTPKKSIKRYLYK